MIIIRNIYDFIKNNKLLFTVFMLLLISSICGILYSVNLLNNIVIENERVFEDERTYIVTLDNVNREEKLNALITEKKDICHVYCLIDNKGETVQADFYGERYKGNKVSFGKWFSDEDVSIGEHKVILPNYPYLSSLISSEEYIKYEIGDTYYINEVAFEAIGIGVLTEFVYQIPFYSIKDEISISGIAVVTNNLKNKEEIQNYSVYLETLFDGTIIKTPEGMTKTSFWDNYSMEMMIIVCIMSIGIFNLIYIYTYILDTRRKEIAIKRVLGQTIFSSVINYYMEILLLASVCYVFGVLIFKYGILLALKNHGFLFNDSINTAYYFLIYGIFVALYSIVFLPVIIRYVSKSPSEALTDD